MSSILTKHKRLLSRDMYRGFTMLLMVSAGFGLSILADDPGCKRGCDTKRSSTC